MSKLGLPVLTVSVSGSNPSAVSRDSHQQRPRPHRGRDLGPQPLTEHRQGEQAAVLLGQHAQPGRAAAAPVQRRLMHSRRLGQLRRGHRPARQEICHAQFRRHVHSPRDMHAPDHREHRRGGGALVLGWLGTASLPARFSWPRRPIGIAAVQCAVPPRYSHHAQAGKTGQQARQQAGRVRLSRPWPRTREPASSGATGARPRQDLRDRLAAAFRTSPSRWRPACLASHPRCRHRLPRR